MLASCEAIVVSLTSSLSDWLAEDEPSLVSSVSLRMLILHAESVRLRGLYLLWPIGVDSQEPTRRKARCTSGLLSRVDDRLDGGCEYSEVFSSSEARTRLITALHRTGFERRCLHPGPMGLLAIL